MVYDVFFISCFNWTVYPIFLEVIIFQKISVGPPFYQKLIIPFLIPFLFAMAIGPKLRWIKSDYKIKYIYFIFDYFILISVFIIKNLNIDFLINTILVTAAFYLFFNT